MAVRVNATRLSRRYRLRLERERKEWQHAADDDGCVPSGWRDGYCAGLEFAQNIIKKGH